MTVVPGEMALHDRAANRWSVRPEGDRTLLVSEAEVEFKGGRLGKVLGLLMAPLMGRMGPASLARFKYLVENGEPHAGKSADLPRPAVAC